MSQHCVYSIHQISTLCDISAILQKKESVSKWYAFLTIVKGKKNVPMKMIEANTRFRIKLAISTEVQLNLFC